MQDSAIELRPASAEDCDLVFRWANDPETRAASFNSEPISLEAHRHWYREALSGARTLQIAERDAQPIGLARLDPVDAGTAEVGLLLDAQYRGQGLAIGLLRALLDFAARSGLRLLIARIRADNNRSRRVFERAGFLFAGKETIGDVNAVRYNYRLLEIRDE